jgi:RNA polymerase sigma-70 factor, ECF subfamily
MSGLRIRRHDSSGEPSGRRGRSQGVTAVTEEALDESALRDLYAEHAGPLLAYLIRLTGDRGRAEDLLQETMLRAWRRAAVFENGRGSARAWLCTVARNLMIDDIRARAARPIEAELTDYTGGVEPDPYEPALLAWEVADALTALSPEHRAVLIEVYYRRATVSQAAQTLGIPPGTVKSRTFYALRALRLAFQERGITQ